MIKKRITQLMALIAFALLCINATIIYYLPMVEDKNNKILELVNKNSENIQTIYQLQQEIALLKNKKMKVTISQGVDSKQYKKLFRDILQSSTIFEDSEIDQYVALVMLTAQTESDFGLVVKQYNSGPALGWFQMEPATEKDLWENYIKYRPKIKQIMEQISHKNVLNTSQLQTNIAYATLMCSLQYKRYVDSGRIKLPAANDRKEQARVWKKVYNTHHGKGTIEKTMHKSLALK